MADVDLSTVAWQKSTRSNGNGTNCVEVALEYRHVLMRDSKHRAGPVLAFAHEGWSYFASAVRAGVFDRRKR